MSLKLILIRHAKSDWGEPGLRDHDRPLNGRGQRDAPKIGAWLAENGHVPEVAFVSSALRTRMTWAAMAEVLPGPISEDVVPSLYEASAQTIMETARLSKADTVAIVGHNPGMGDAMHRICAQVPDHPRFHDVPTGATLVVRMAGQDWGDIGWGSGELVDFITPHDL